MLEYKVLDHGYVKLVESWGSDERVIEAARMSTGKGFLGWGPKHQPSCITSTDSSYDCNCATMHGDEKLLRYLYTNHHSTPFEMGGMIIEVQAPIFVFREWHRHRTQSYNELSARYTPLPDVNYYPTVERLLMKDSKNKQAQGLPRAEGHAPEFSDEYLAAEWLLHLQDGYQQAQSLYDEGLRRGLPKELARIILPVGRYSRMRASANLRNWLAFMTLRCAKNAQWEIRQYANAVSDIVRQLFPRTHELFVEGFNE